MASILHIHRIKSSSFAGHRSIDKDILSRLRILEPYPSLFFERLQDDFFTLLLFHGRGYIFRGFKLKYG